MLVDLYLYTRLGPSRRHSGLWRWRRGSLNDGRARSLAVGRACVTRPPDRLTLTRDVNLLAAGDVRRRANNAVIWPRSIIFPASQPSVRPSGQGMGMGRRAAAAGGPGCRRHERNESVKLGASLLARPFHAYCLPTVPPSLTAVFSSAG